MPQNQHRNRDHHGYEGAATKVMRFIQGALLPTPGEYDEDSAELCALLRPGAELRPSRFLLTFLCCLPLLAGAQQSSPSGETQPQVWPPAQAPAKTVAPAPPQPSKTPAVLPPGAAAPHIPSGQIQLDVVVTDKQGSPVAGLNRGDFTLLDDNRPAAIQSFQAFGGSAAQPGPPVEIFIVVDTVNLGFQEVSYSRFGIDQFLRSNGGRLANPVSIYWYTDTDLEGVGRPSTDGNALAAELDATEGHLRTINRDAGAWGAIERFEMSTQMVDRIVKTAAQHPGRKLLVWIGPGWPMLDSPNMEMSWKEQQSLFSNIVELSTELREARMQIYSVTPGMPTAYTYLFEGYLKGVKKPSQAYLPDLDLKVLAVQSGGLALSPSNDLASEIEKSARDASPYYTISFTPPRADGPNEYHELKVRVDKRDLTARTSTGYYNQPQGAPTPR